MALPIAAIVEAPRPALSEKGFRREKETPSVHNGKPVWVAVCHELIDGRWEGFVSMRGRTVADEVQS